MRLEAITTAVRPRGEWEAVDLGLLMVRRHWRAIWGAWLACVVPLWAVLYPFLHPVWDGNLMLLVVWWLKPLYDRLVLHVLGEALFGPPPTVTATLRALPGLLLSSGLVTALTLGRLDPARSFKLPVWQLERVRGKRRRERHRVLNKRAWGSASWLTFACVNLEIIFGIGLALLLLLLVPTNVSIDLELLFTGGEAWPAWLTHLTALISLLALTLVEPFYVGGGFGLYINRRVQLEGWDIELAFRRMADRLAPGHRANGRSGIAAALAALLCLALFALPTPPLQAAPRMEPPMPPGEAIKEVLAAPEFAHTENARRWYYRGTRERGGEETLDLEGSFIGPALGTLIEILLWLAGLALVAWLLLNARRWSALFRAPAATTRAERPAEVMGLDIRPDSLPDDIPAAARELWRQGEGTAALGLLYRGALAALVHRHAVPLTRGSTERECLRLTQPHIQEAPFTYFSALTRAWLAAAYARRTPSDEELERLCGRWGEHFTPEPPA